MKLSRFVSLSGQVLALTCLLTLSARADDGVSLVDGDTKATITATATGELRSYTLTSNAELRDKAPADGRVEFAESAAQARLRTGNLLFDGLYALAVHEAQQDSVSQIKDGSYGNGAPIILPAFQTGALWTYVWTRDLSYSAHLGLAGYDPNRAGNSLLFKTSALKPSVQGGFANQIVQDTGSGGSYPVSTDRIVWSLGASEWLMYLPNAERSRVLKQIYPLLRGTLEQDRRLVFDPADGLYRGEQSFLDWREQTYPLWTRNNVLPIALSKALSVNTLNYFALRMASELAGRLGRDAERTRYAQWAAALKAAINRRFYSAADGLYSTYLLTDADSPVRVHRYDLLGESLAILLDVASAAQAKQILSQYPTGPYGPPVVWPEERDVPIYHNHAIWPFVTAYWIKAARQANNAEAVDRGVRSLMRGAAFNLSNMENLDVGTGKAWMNDGKLQGPVINSQRQLWSVAGYLSMVQDVVFGLEASWDGVRFLPFVPARMRREMFAATKMIDLRGFRYQGKTIDVRVHLPAASATDESACRVGRIVLNGKKIGSGFVAAASLPAHSTWDVFLEDPAPDTHSAQAVRTVSDERDLFGPAQPEWEDVGQRGITLENSLLTLHYRHPDATQVVFSIYRDGVVCAKNVKSTLWTDPRSGDSGRTTHFYTVEAVDPKTGNASHLAPTRFYTTEKSEWIIPATQMINRGGDLVAGHHFENWGKPGDQLQVKELSVGRSGRYQIRVEFSNGAGPVNTGITCAVKKLEVYNPASKTPVAAGYLIMPQSGDWTRFDLSSVVRADLKAGEKYSVVIGEDEYCRNMSYLQINARYTAGSGGGDAPYNYVNIASVHLLHIED